MLLFSSITYGFAMLAMDKGKQALMQRWLPVSYTHLEVYKRQLLTLDRYVGTNFLTNDLGGNPMLYVNLIWIWGHPEVYILILPLFGVYSEVASTFCGKRLFGYASMVYATVVITILSYLVWLHHFFTMGSGASVNSFFGITTMIRCV